MENGTLTLFVYGTQEKPPQARRIEAGPLSAEFVSGAVRRLSWRGVEVIRGIDCPVRDKDWATLSFEALDEDFETSADGFEAVHRRVFAGGSLSCRVRYRGSGNGTFTACFEAEAREDFLTCRAGFTLLHPLSVVGSAMTVGHSDGSIETLEFPELILPGQPAFDMAKLRYRVGDVETDIAFRGDIFEMEDQRNWSDASFKTYCRPLSRPYPYLIRAGEKIRQEIEISLRGGGATASASSNTSGGVLNFERTGERMPAVALAVDEGFLPTEKESLLIRKLEPRILQIRTRPDECGALLEKVGALCGLETEIEIEAVIPTGRDIDESLKRLADACNQLGVRAARILALPEAYLQNYQPSGPWPEGPGPTDAFVAAQKYFPRSELGVGMLTHFVELNRRRPPTDLGDYVSHGSTAILHAADDRSVIETLEGLAHIFRSARAIAGSRKYRLGLVSIGMRTNPHGQSVAPNPEQKRVAMAGADPRQRGLFAAAWAVGALAASEGRGVSSLALAAPVGPFGLIYRPSSWPQPFYDERGGPLVYPIFHVFRALSSISNAPRLAFRGLPEGVVGVGAQTETGVRLILANLADQRREVDLPLIAGVRRLDRSNFASAVENPDWIAGGPDENARRVALDPFDIAFASAPHAG